MISATEMVQSDAKIAVLFSCFGLFQEYGLLFSRVWLSQEFQTSHKLLAGTCFMVSLFQDLESRNFQLFLILP